MYYRNEQKTIADIDVRIKSVENNVTVYGSHFEDYDKKHYSLMTGTPLLVQIDTSSDGKIDTLLITSRTMEAYRDSANERFIAMTAFRSCATRCRHVPAMERTCWRKKTVSWRSLQKNPIVWYGDNQLTGDSIAVLHAR